MPIAVEVYLDGATPPHGFGDLLQHCVDSWRVLFPDAESLVFLPPVDLKVAHSLPDGIREIAHVRNPDVFFRLTTGELLGGVEVTVHSPDGSNIEKRYPYLWASREQSLPAFVATPYQKWRSSGSVNRLPRRHAQRNLVHLEQWDVTNPHTAPIQLMAIRELHGMEEKHIDPAVRQFMPGWSDLGTFFAARAAQLSIPDLRQRAEETLYELRQRWTKFVRACIENTKFEDPSTLLRLKEKWIQIYNARPDTGHWERGEGQFDSIDGRLMFTLESIEFTRQEVRPSQFEFWLPQIVSSHPWVVEQVERGYSSKRFRNILRVLPARSRVALFSVKFSDDLTDDDWRLLQQNQALCLTRLDTPPTLFSLAQLLQGVDLEALSSNGLKAKAKIEVVRACLAKMPGQYLSTHRASLPGWEDALTKALTAISPGSRVLVPRIPAHLLESLPVTQSLTVVPAEGCTKAELLALRQLHRTGIFYGGHDDESD